MEFLDDLLKITLIGLGLSVSIVFLCFSWILVISATTDTTNSYHAREIRYA